MSQKLLSKTRRYCEEWELRPFTKQEKLRDFAEESYELIEAIAKLKGKEEIQHEYGDILFTLIRQSKDEENRKVGPMLYHLLPFKKMLDIKLKMLDDRNEWWLKNHGFKSIRNYKNPEKRAKIIARHNGKIPNQWIR